MHTASPQAFLGKLLGADSTVVKVNAPPQLVHDTGVNAVLVPRAAPEGVSEALQQLLGAIEPFTSKMVVGRGNAAQQVAQLLAALPEPGIRSAVEADVLDRCTEFLEVMGCKSVDAKLQVVTTTSCSRWHADHVAVRCLVTYCGPGTLLVENKHVRRHSWQRKLLGADADVGGYELVPGAVVQQAAEWDVLWLKGQGYPGFEGRGAVHRSPDEASTEAPRLLLALDVACEDACCAH